MINTYIINLPSSIVRKRYMEDLMRPLSFLNVEFVEAVNGKSLSDNTINALFDYHKSFLHYGRKLSKGEVGCTLSHRKCYELLLASSEKYILVLEDDIRIIKKLKILKSQKVRKLLNSNKPVILFLSGDYWYYRYIDDIVKVYSAVGSYAYLINKEAAKLIVDSGTPFNVADDWRLYRKLGIILYAIKPYLVDANVQMDILGTDIQQESWGINRHNMPIKEVLHSLLDSLTKKVLKVIGHFESKIRVINNKVVNE